MWDILPSEINKMKAKEAFKDTINNENRKIAL